MKPTYSLSIHELAPMPEGLFEVTVFAEHETVHQVHVRDEYYQKLTDGKISAIDLIEKSFDFLLERESNTSILKAFDLADITRYFLNTKRR